MRHATNHVNVSCWRRPRDEKPANWRGFRFTWLRGRELHPRPQGYAYRYGFRRSTYQLANGFVVWTIPSSRTTLACSVRPGACHLVSTPSSQLEKLGSVLPLRDAKEVSPNLTSVPFTITRERALKDCCFLTCLRHVDRKGAQF